MLRFYHIKLQLFFLITAEVIGRMKFFYLIIFCITHRFSFLCGPNSEAQVDEVREEASKSDLYSNKDRFKISSSCCKKSLTSSVINFGTIEIIFQELFL